MKAESTIKQEIRRLQSVVDSPEEDAVSKRVAWEVMHALRWVVEDVKGWGSRVESCRATAALIRREIHEAACASPPTRTTG